MSKFTTTTEVRLSYTNLLTPRSQQNSDGTMGALTYSTAVLIPKTDVDTIKGIKAAIAEALAEGKTKKWGGKVPSNLKNPLRDGDDDRSDDPEYKGVFFVNAKGPRAGKEPVILLGKNGQATESATVIYSGVYARVSLQFYPFDTNGNRGIACGVTSVLSSERGEPLANVVTAESARAEFGVVTPASSAASEFSAATGAPAAEADDDDPWAS